MGYVSNPLSTTCPMALNNLYESVIWGEPEPESHDIVKDAIRKERVLKCVALPTNLTVTD